MERSCHFAYSGFQTYVATKIVTDKSKTTVAHLPTGVGKSFIAAMTGEYLRTVEGKRVAIVTTQSFLVGQMKRMLGTWTENISVLTMERALLCHKDFDAFIIDESDECLLEAGVAIDHSVLQAIGFWDLMEKRTILLTATIGFDLNIVLFELFGIRQRDVLTFNKHLLDSK